MRIGIVCPYSFDAPGGVQFHIRDLAEELLDRGHEVSVLAPAEETEGLLDFVVPAGGSIAIPYNGSVARLSFGPAASSHVSRWLAEHRFEIVHIHEPLAPSLGLLALWQSKVPIVATFHSSQDRSRAMSFVAPAAQRSLEKIGARIAVSEAARRTVADHLGGDAVVIPNGVDLASFRQAGPREQWMGRRHGGAPTICFLGRLDEPRKGLPVFAGAVGHVLQHVPEARFLIAGRGEAAGVREQLAPYGERVAFLGEVSEADKKSLFASADIYVAPQTGGESFGIVLVEAMAGGATVVASDIPAFRDVTGGGVAGRLFSVGDSGSLAQVLLDTLAGDAPTPEEVAGWSARFDWDSVASRVLEVYRLVTSGGEIDVPEHLVKRQRRWPWRRRR
ncbi:MAG TPA: glycosyltransferase family 4 protein [Actinomycetales bacterium]|nr:glycosyltransferase family 4 protein [Actinomycetales bacterium]